MSEELNCRKFKFNQKLIDTLPPHDAESKSREAEYSDQEVTGLKLLVGKSGRKTYYLRYTYRGRKRIIRIGEHGPLTVPEARRMANDFKRKILEGIDPADEREAERKMPLFEEFALNEYLPHAKATKRSADMDESRLKAYLIPRFGRYRLDDIPPQEIQRMHNQLKDTLAPATTNRILCLIHHLLELAIQWGHLEKNPAAGIKKHPENNERQRYLSREELLRFQAALDKLRNPVAASYFRFLLLTGARKNEAVFATWEHIDLEEGRWWIPETKSGKGRWVILNEAAKELLKSIRSVPGNPYVFPGKFPERPFGNAQDTFEKLKELARITDGLRIHDLRHTYASIAINNGATLYEVQHLLGHSNSQTTQRYAHMAEDTLRKVSGKVADMVTLAKADVAS